MWFPPESIQPSGASTLILTGNKQVKAVNLLCLVFANVKSFHENLDKSYPNLLLDNVLENFPQNITSLFNLCETIFLSQDKVTTIMLRVHKQKMRNTHNSRENAITRESGRAFQIPYEKSYGFFSREKMFQYSTPASFHFIFLRSWLLFS